MATGAGEEVTPADLAQAVEAARHAPRSTLHAPPPAIAPRLVEWRGETVDVSARRLPDIIAPGLAVLFVGFNPSVMAGLTGHYYARPGNRFWTMLHLAGLTPRLYTPQEDRTLLDLGIGITDLCPIPTPGVDDVPRAVATAGREALAAKIARHRPRIVCFNGKATYTAFFGHQPAAWGAQAERIAGSRVFVVPSSSGRANAVSREREAAFIALGTLVRAGAPSEPA